MTYNIEPGDMPPRGRSPESRARQREYDRTRRGDRHRTVDPRDRRMIAWDGEGMKLLGPRNPQNYVLFGCSAVPDSPLMIKDHKGDLLFEELIDYACDVAQQFPHAFHVGYYFAYDQNMIVKHLNAPQKMVLHERNGVQVRRDDTLYRVKWIPQKRITLSRERNGKRVSLTIDDMASFFASSFVRAYRGLFPEDVDSERFRLVVEGKANRADMMFYDMPRVLRYWQAEISLLERLGERFRTIMYDAGFILRDWYGPGALANYIRKTHDLARHEHGGKQEFLPDEVHDASKRAYFGGRFEQLQAGRIRGPVYSYDIRSAYPAAFTQLPSMREGGTWVHVDTPTRCNRIGVYRIRYRQDHPIPWTPQPLPHRSQTDANVTFPGMVDGWYWTPEASAAVKYYGAEVLDGWEWHPVDVDERPWAIFRDMFAHRTRLKAMHNSMEMAFKLGPNSMYGKMAQRVGFDPHTKTPPRAHTLPIAGWITAYCRASILEVMALMPPSSVVAVETDGIFSTHPPDGLGLTIGDELGDWEVKTYDEMLYVQSGVYLCRRGDVWSVKSRGMDSESITYETIIGYLRGLQAGEPWEPMDLPQRERFLGLGAAISRSTSRSGGEPNPFKLGALHCRWEEKPRALGLGEKGKRIHLPVMCPACKRGESAASGAHRLMVHAPAAQKDPVSFPYMLPWEDGYTEPEWLRMDRVDDAMIERHEI